MIRSTIILILLFNFGTTFAQVGKLLKERARQAIQDPRLRDALKTKFDSELEEMRSEYDTTSFNYAIALSDNAGLFESKEQFERQKKFLIEYVQRKDEEEISAEDRARGWVDRSEILYATGKYKLAMGMLIGAKALYEESDSENTIDYARTIANMSLVAHSLGRLRFAEELAGQAMELRLNLLGRESRGYAASLNNYALLLKDLGSYNESEKEMNGAVELNRAILGGESMGYAITLNNQANLYQVLGRYEEAESLYRRALDISMEHLQERSGNYQRLQTNLALLYQDMGRFPESESLLKEAIRLKEQRFGKTHPDYAHMLNTLASLYVDMGKDEEVERLLKESLAIYTAKMGENSKNAASVKSDLGNFYRYKGRYAEALPLLQNVWSVRKNILGEDHPETIESTEDLALVQWKLENHDPAKILYNDVMTASLKEINNYFLPMSEAEKSKYWKKMRPRFQRYYAFAAEQGKDDPELLRAVFDLQLATKALLLNTGNKIKDQILNGSDEELKSRYANWIDQKEALAHYYTYSKEELAEEKINIDSLEREANVSEKYLSENSLVFSEGMKLTQVRYPDVVQLLGGDEAIVEIIQAKKFTTHLTNESAYLALIVKKGSTAPELVVLENGSQLEGRYFKYYNNAVHTRIDDTYSYEQYWAPIDDLVKGKSRIYLSLDGIFNQINLSTLRKPDGSFLVSSYNLTLLSNSKDLAKIKNRSGLGTGKDVFLLGFPDYGGDGSIAQLPGTKREIESISGLLKARKYAINMVSGPLATESAVKEIRSPSVVHIATHGYFLEDLGAGKGKVFGINVEKARENPLLRSGLLFSQAGKTAIGAQSADLSGSNNGILTAYEGMNLHFENTQLVVLSACETGLGDVVAGEGVYGLQRSLMIAGAHHLIMSLWKVDDAATQKLMTSFYTYLGESGDISSSFRKAQDMLRKEYPHPYYWGAFILISG